MKLMRYPAALVAVLMMQVIYAHDGGTTGYAEIAIDGRMIRYTLTLSVMPAGSRSDSLSSVQSLLQAIREKIVFTNNDRLCQAGPAQLAPAASVSLSVTAVADFVCPGIVQTLMIRDELFSVLDSNLHTLTKIEWPGGSRQFVFASDTPQLLMIVETGETGETAEAKTSFAGGTGRFFLLGFEHILSGYDHLLFLLALILGGGSLLTLLKIITAFTIAHSITLSLAALDLVSLPGRLVEAGIAASIAYVAAENLFPRYAVTQRWMVSFLFGLLHGFGFASVLHDLGLPGANLVMMLLNFNLGVETGQIAVILVVAPILLYLKTKPFSPQLNAALSGIVLVIGIGLLVERVLY